MKVVVTGGAGFIGSNLCARLSECSDVDDLVSFDDYSTGVKSNLQKTIAKATYGSILNPQELDNAIRDATVVVHLAALPSVPRSLADPMASHLVNATGTINVLESCRKHHVEQVIVASSSSVYGNQDARVKREDMPVRPLSPYAVSKLATEQYALAWQHSFGLRTLAFRFFNVFGPHQLAGHAYAAVIPSFVSSALHDQAVQIHGDGSQTRDFTFVGTVCDVIVEAIRNRVSCVTPVNLAFGGNSSLLEILGMIEELLGKRIERQFQPARRGDVAHSCADKTLLTSLFPELSPVDLKIGLGSTIDWMRSIV